MDNKKVFMSEKYKVSFCENGVEKSSPVYIALLANGMENNQTLPKDVYKVYDGLGMGTRSTKTYYSSFEFENGAEVRIAMPPETTEVTVKPSKYQDKITFEGNTAVFKAEETMCMAIEPNGDIFGSLHIFCNKKKNYKSDSGNVIEFTDGIYTVDNCEYISLDEHGAPVIGNIPDNTIIYIGENAVVNAAIELVGVKNVKILGTGTVSLIDRCHGADEEFAGDMYWGAFRYYAKTNILIRSGCENIEIDGVLLNCEFRGIVIRNSENIIIRNVKMFTSTENADGINCYNASDLLVEDCYIQSADDCFCMYNSCDSIPTLFDEGYTGVKAVCRNIEVRNCVMSSNARPVVLGGHATGETDPRCIIEDIYMHDCEIINTPYRIFGNTEEYSNYWSGFLRILSQSEQIVRGLKFENITVTVTKGHNGKIFHLEVRGKRDASYTEHEGYRIEDITFRNIRVVGCTEKLIRSVIKCRSSKGDGDEPMIKDILFENVFCDGKISESNFAVSGPVENIIIK